MTPPLSFVRGRLVKLSLLAGLAAADQGPNGEPGFFQNLVKLAVAGDAYRRCVCAARGCACGTHMSCVCTAHVVCVCEWGHSMLYRHSVCARVWACAGQRYF